MVIDTKENSETTNKLEKVFTLGNQDLLTKETLKIIKWQELEFLNSKMEILMKVNV